MRSLVLMGLCCARVALAQTAEPPASEAAIAALEKSIAAIKSFDVFIQMERNEDPTTTEPVDPFQASPRGQQKKGTGNDHIEHWMLHQIYSSDGRYRFEQRTKVNDRPFGYTEVFTGEFMRKVHLPSRGQIPSCVVSRGIPEKIFNSQVQHFYVSWFRNVLGFGNLMELLHEQGSVKFYVDKDFPSLVAFEADGRNQKLPTQAVRYLLDPVHGMLPKRIDVFVDQFAKRQIRYEIEEYREVAAGVWSPTKATFYYGPAEGPIYETHCTVDVKRSRWNQPIDEKQFVLPFPPGAFFESAVDQMFGEVGKADSGTDTKLLIENGLKLHRYPP